MVKQVEFSFDEAVRTLGVTPVRLQKLIDEGQIPTVQEGSRLLIPRHAILDYLSQVSAVPIKERKGRGAQA
jgi:excisionase family DNA binding protein